MKHPLLIAIPLALSGLFVIFTQYEPTPIVVNEPNLLTTDSRVQEENTGIITATMPAPIDNNQIAHEQHNHSEVRHARQASKASLLNRNKQARIRKTPIDNIDLSTEQQAKYHAQLSEYTQQRKRLVKKRNRISPETYRDELTEIKLQHQQKLASFMSEKQFATYKENIQLYMRNNKKQVPPRKHSVQEKRDQNESQTRSLNSF